MGKSSLQTSYSYDHLLSKSHKMFKSLVSYHYQYHGKIPCLVHLIVLFLMQHISNKKILSICSTLFVFWSFSRLRTSNSGSYSVRVCCILLLKHHKQQLDYLQFCSWNMMFDPHPKKKVDVFHKPCLLMSCHQRFGCHQENKTSQCFHKKKPCGFKWLNVRDDNIILHLVYYVHYT